jgi:hypothetical protein
VGIRLALAGAAVALWAAPTRGQSTGGVTLQAGGYVRSLTALQDLGYDTPLADRRSAFNGEILRLKWQLGMGERVRIIVHDRLQVQLSSTRQSLGTGIAGFGVSAVPGRTISLETTLLEDEQYRIWHDLDRLAVNVRSGIVDLTLGRQAVTWGISSLFPVADLWAQFSPFELDTEEKRGVDAVRGLAYPAPGVELDLVLADRGTLRDLSAGLRATVDLPWADVYVAAGKFWRQLIALGGVSLVLESWIVRGEAALPWEMDATELRPLRATVGADRLSAKYQVSIEYHHNGLGATDPDGYVGRLAAAELQRGETYFLGRHYLGAFGSYLPTDRLTLSTSLLGNLQDPSITVSPVATYDVGQNARISAGALIATGATPRLTAEDSRLRSEFGAYGRLVYATVSVYF